MPVTSVPHAKRIFEKYHRGFKVDSGTGKSKKVDPVQLWQHKPTDHCWDAVTRRECIAAPTCFSEAVGVAGVPVRTLTDVAILRREAVAEVPPVVGKHSLDSFQPGAVASLHATRCVGRRHAPARAAVARRRHPGRPSVPQTAPPLPGGSGGAVCGTPCHLTQDSEKVCGRRGAQCHEEYTIYIQLPLIPVMASRLWGGFV